MEGKPGPIGPDAIRFDQLKQEQLDPNRVKPGQISLNFQPCQRWQGFLWTEQRDGKLFYPGSKSPAAIAESQHKHAPKERRVKSMLCCIKTLFDAPDNTKHRRIAERG